jgi:DNA-binding IclR family transcriptional regulator
VLLAFRPVAALEHYLEQPLERFTERTLVDPDALQARLREVRRDGYAWVREEFDRGINSVAAPIADVSGEVVAAVHLHGPSYRFPTAGSEALIAERVVTTAARIAGSLRQA